MIICRVIVTLFFSLSATGFDSRSPSELYICELDLTKNPLLLYLAYISKSDVVIPVVSCTDHVLSQMKIDSSCLFLVTLV